MRFLSQLVPVALLGLIAAQLTAGSAPGEWPRPLDLPLSPLPSGLSSLVPVPVENPLSWEKIDLGRHLFSDKRLSKDGSVSCASCHQPDKQFTDGRALPVGINGQSGRRNVPSLVNAAYRKMLFWDGRAATLEEQALLPLTNPHEMGHTLKAIVALLAKDGSYRAAFKRAFGSAEITGPHIAQALATYQRTLVAGNSAYDRYDWFHVQTALSDAARRGLMLFRDKARCAHCHEGRLFTDQKFHNTGVGWGKQPLDLGRFEHTRAEEDQGKFQTPTLRNVTLTAPYMHDGSIQTLTEVIEFYNRGGQSNSYLSRTIQPLHLSSIEKADLLEFLKALDTSSYGRASFSRRAGGGSQDEEISAGMFTQGLDSPVPRQPRP